MSNEAAIYHAIELSYMILNKSYSVVFMTQKAALAAAAKLQAGGRKVSAYRVRMNANTGRLVSRGTVDLIAEGILETITVNPYEAEAAEAAAAHLPTCPPAEAVEAEAAALTEAAQAEAVYMGFVRRPACPRLPSPPAEAYEAQAAYLAACPAIQAAAAEAAEALAAYKAAQAAYLAALAAAAE
jgi:hypothetical protein